VFGLNKLLSVSAGKWFVSTRGLSSVLSLTLALSYTKILGLEKRSILTFIMVSAVILTTLLTSGISLALRNKPRSEIRDEEFSGYIIIIGFAGLMVATINCALLSVYSYVKVDIPPAIYLICFFYSLLSCANLGYQDALLALGQIKLAAFFDILTIVLQGITLAFLAFISQTSLIVSVFIAFIFSYSLISFATVSIIFTKIDFSVSSIKSGAKSLVLQSKSQQVFGIANGLADRIDRFIIGLMLPVTFLAKYALLSSLISFARFLPDSALKMRLHKIHKGEKTKDFSYSVRSFFFICLLGICLVFSAQLMLFFFFGPQWLLPLSVSALLVTQEILRGNFQLRGIKLIASGHQVIMQKISLLLILLSLALIPSATIFIGIWGAPLAMVTVYFVCTVLVEIQFKRHPHVA